MTQDANEDISATIKEAENSIRRIAEELGRMKTAAELLDESGKRSQLLQDSVEKLVSEISSLVELSGQVIDSLNASEIRALVTEMQTVLSRRMDGLKKELLEMSKSDTERVGAELQTALIEHLGNVGTEIVASTESNTGRVSAELRGALIQRLDILEKKITSGTETTAEQVGAELRGALVQRIDSLENDLGTNTSTATGQVSEDFAAANAIILKRLTELDSQVADLQELATKILKRKLIFF